MLREQLFNGLHPVTLFFWLHRLIALHSLSRFCQYVPRSWSRRRCPPFCLEYTVIEGVKLVFQRFYRYFLVPESRNVYMCSFLIASRLQSAHFAFRRYPLAAAMEQSFP